MISKRLVESALKRYRDLREENPDLLSEDANAIIVAASNDAVAQALYGLGSSVEQNKEPIQLVADHPWLNAKAAPSDALSALDEDEWDRNFEL